MTLTRPWFERWTLTACAAAALSCSGSADPLLDPLASRSTVPDAGASSAPDHAQGPALPDDGGQQDAGVTPGSPYVGRGYDFVPDAAAADGSTNETASDESADATTGAPTPPVTTDGGAPLGAVYCPVTFTVDSAFVDGFVYQAVMVGGDAPALGDWNTSAAPRMTAAAAPMLGAWGTSVSLQDGETVHFKFGKTSTDGSTIEWEMLPGGDRALVVVCGGTGTTYAGQYGTLSDGS